MSSKDKNLSHKSGSIDFDFSEIKIGVVVSKWNEKITYSLRDACISTLKDAGITSENIILVEVPGSFEIPIASKMLLQHQAFDAIVGLGCVIKGETQHDEYINTAVANGLTQLSLISSKPCIFGVLTPNTMEQALERSGGKYGNKGVEAANTALQMIALKEGLSLEKKSIGF